MYYHIEILNLIEIPPKIDFSDTLKIAPISPLIAVLGGIEKERGDVVV